MRLAKQIEVKLLSKIAERVLRGRPEECWPWQGGISDTGYGVIMVGVPAHRLAYILEHGEIPEGLHINHLCRNRSCCNPHHLEAVTQAENNRYTNADKTECLNGHPYNSENTYYKPNGQKFCKVCKRDREQRNKRRAS